MNEETRERNEERRKRADQCAAWAENNIGRDGATAIVNALLAIHADLQIIIHEGLPQL